MENKYNYYNPDSQKNSYDEQYHSNQYNNSYGNDWNQNYRNSKKKFPKILVTIGCALIFGVVASITFQASNVVGDKIFGTEIEEQIESEAQVEASSSGANVKTNYSVITSDVTNVVESVMPSVVSITNLSIQEVQNFFGQTIQYESTGAGSGIIISETDEELLIVTNYHVIEGSETLTVTFYDESSIEAYVKGTDSTTDLAVIAIPLEDIPEETKEVITVATLGDSTQLKAGEPAIAIGNALGYGQSVTVGVISALNRTATATDETTGEAIDTGVQLIQTDAAINPGNSGGALLNANGEVIGINSSKMAATDVEGMGYAIPISDVSDILDSLMNQKTKRKVADDERGYLGITGFDVTSENAQRYGMPVGVYVESVADKGGAKDAGITKGNIITGLDGTTIENMEELQRELSYHAIGEEVVVTVQIPENNGEYTEKNVSVVLGEAQN
ncbi:MAG: trypsin-like peptidase domain-containing protein [Ruminococcus sp.]|nr:trypsin-like peptidase domain-containing protein [Ruminococcus sp.]